MVLWETYTLIQRVFPYPCAPHSLRSDNPTSFGSYRSFHIRDRWVGVLNLHASFVIPLDQNCSKDHNLQTAISDSESILTKYVLIKSFDSLNISHWGRFEILSPGASLFYLNLFPLTQIALLNLAFKVLLEIKLFAFILNNWNNIFEHTPKFLWKCAISDASYDFVENIYISNISRICISSFWIQAY